MKIEDIAWDFVPTTATELKACLSSPMWRLCSGQLYWIMVRSETDETGTTIERFRPNRAQRRFIARLWNRNLILKARQLGFCVDEDTRVLTADLRWVRIADLRAGDEVVATDEHAPGGKGHPRKMRTATVMATATMEAETFRITLDDGRSVICTDRHPWLTRGNQGSKWASLSGKGNAVTGKLQVGGEIRWVTKPWTDGDIEDGWMGGLIDGEGSIARANTAASINVSQRVGPVWKRLNAYLADRGYHHRIEQDAAERPGKHGTTPVPKAVVGRMDEMFRLIGQTRPTRFIDNRFWEGRELPGKKTGEGWAEIVSIEPLGKRKVVDLQTSTGTYIAEGFVSHNTTLMAIVWLDHALFNANQRCAIIAQDATKASEILRDKIIFAYDRLPQALREAMPIASQDAEEVLFAHNNSSIKVAQSVRGGTYQRLHISELGAIAANFPKKAKEIQTGSLPAVPADGIIVIESTAEGQEGLFYRMALQAMANAELQRPLTAREYRFHFEPWHEEEAYAMDPRGVIITAADHEYFDKLERDLGKRISIRQRAWYCAFRRSEFGDDPALMWQEMPSFPEEAFQQSLEGAFYAKQLAKARIEGRIGAIPIVTGVPVNTFWDIGSRDGTAIWLHQEIGPQHRFIGFIEGWFEGFEHYVKELEKFDVLWGTHYLPHDADALRQGKAGVISPRQMLQDLRPRWDFDIVDRVEDITHGISAMRLAFSEAYFDEVRCADGIAHLQGYRRERSPKTGAWLDTPYKNEHTEAADAIRQWAQMRQANRLFGTHEHGTPSRQRRRHKGGAMAV